MRCSVIFFIFRIALWPIALWAQSADDDLHVYTDSPRLLLTKQRLRLLQREVERKSERWEQLDALISGGAPMPEAGFASALHYRTAGDRASARRAVDWALSPAAKDMRQLALVFDWCGPILTDSEAAKLEAKLQTALSGPIASVEAARDRVFASVALADRLPDQGESALRSIVQGWWGRFLEPLKSGRPLVPREQSYALFELLHAIRDNVKIDLRESAPDYFRDFPLEHLYAYSPMSFPGPENDFRVPVYLHAGDPDLNEAAMARAADLVMVAYDTNATETQYLQGWLTKDRFIMRGALGVTYEFLWANPYQPGLSYMQLPLLFHDAQTGHIFARSNWEDDATWLGYFEGRVQLFHDGKIQSLRAGAAMQPVHLGGAVIATASSRDHASMPADAEKVIVLGLDPKTVYDVEVDDQEMEEAETDPGGTLVFTSFEGLDLGARLHRAK